MDCNWVSIWCMLDIACVSSISLLCYCSYVIVTAVTMLLDPTHYRMVRLSL